MFCERGRLGHDAGDVAREAFGSEVAPGFHQVGIVGAAGSAQARDASSVVCPGRHKSLRGVGKPTLAGGIICHSSGLRLTKRLLETIAARSDNLTDDTPLTTSVIKAPVNWSRLTGKFRPQSGQRSFSVTRAETS